MKICQFLKSSAIKRMLKHIQGLSIGWKTFFSFLSLFLLMMFSINLLILNYQKKLLREQIYTNISNTLENLSKEIIDNLVFFDPLAIDEKISLAASSPGIEYLMIIDQNGRIVGHTDKSKLEIYVNSDYSR